MRKVIKKYDPSYHLFYTYLIAFILLGFTWFLQWILGLVMSILLGIALYYTIRQEQKETIEQAEYIMTLSHRVRKVGEEALLEMPVGIVLYSEDFQIEWVNAYLNQFAGEGSFVGESLDAFSDKLKLAIKEDHSTVGFYLESVYFHVIIKKEERLLYFVDQTKQVEIQKDYDNHQPVIGIVFLDNYEEITQTMDDTAKSQVNSHVTTILNQWSDHYGIYLKRTSQDRFLALMNQEILLKLEKAKFEILNEVRELVSDNKNIPLTISLGIGIGRDTLPQLGKRAQSSLDLALGRGGDQVVIRDEEGKVQFFGGKTNPMEKRTRVRARVISDALKHLMQESDQIFIMGHKSPDMDSIGSAIGVLKIALVNELEAFIVIDVDDLDVGVDRLVAEIEQTELKDRLITPEDALERVTKSTLTVVVDTHRPSLVAEAKLLAKTDHVVVIDHHRRGEEFIDDPTLVYMEPYASSTAELVTELIEYQSPSLKLNCLEATALLAGIIVDTNSFTFRTGARTFDAASYLRSKNADTLLVQSFLEEDLEDYIMRSHLIERTLIYKDSIAIAQAEPGQVFSSVVIAQTADTLLKMRHISASFVISERSDGRVGISARSAGDVNVQVIMEQMNGGGHLTNAATQLEGVTTQQAKEQLLEIIDQSIGGGDE
ncbi:DHH family phosphoesterase [Amphibacillus sp. MSJ-3]|uniref:DHH family phosphoesterase n=1 Tax=Amphibacillus sp. MSJ-3 TaxID=2841505 RepID=UPI001C0EC9DB|nr:DHH family phosphoesterase [Amphibacillus sp. MSJ-3]MBU5594463.1 DHH family phosphoesterase [Amphibacillus sp. MSJ-3]